MAKIKTSISIETVSYDELKAIARKFFDGNVSKVIEWFGYSKKEKIEFFRFMSKWHAIQLQNLQEIIELQK